MKISFKRLLNASIVVSAFIASGAMQGAAANTAPRKAALETLHGFAESVIYAFPKQYDPFGSLAADSKGNIYGAALHGDQSGAGLIFKLTRSGTGYTEAVVLDFKNTNAYNPYGGVIADSGDNIYAATRGGGTFGYGAIFKILPNGSATALYNFKGATDGESPTSLAVDAAGNLYGTTYGGGTYGLGTLYELSVPGVKTILHSFGAAGDGKGPFYGNTGSLLLQNGVLLGTTNSGGAKDLGTVWAITLGGKETILHSFQGGRFDGSGPSTGVISDGEGNLYGTTGFGGHFNKGTAFIVNPSGDLTIIHNYGDVGSEPSSLMLHDDVLYGTTFLGGPHYGTAFQLQDTQSGYAVNLLHTFGPLQGTDGCVPGSALIVVDGRFFGSTESGGKSGGGTVYELTPE